MEGRKKYAPPKSFLVNQCFLQEVCAEEHGWLKSRNIAENMTSAQVGDDLWELYTYRVI